MSDIFDLTALELGAAIRQGEVSPTQAARAALDRMEETKENGAFVAVTADRALDRAREISSLLLDGFQKGKLKEIFVVYTDMESSLLSEAKSTRLLPFHRTHFAPPAKEKAVQDPFEFYPSVGAVLNNMIPSYVSGFVYSALLDSFCSEQNARMTAMDAANRNAEELLSTLKLQYNRVRQAAITQEITEISAGAAAQRGAFGKEGTV